MEADRYIPEFGWKKDKYDGRDFIHKTRLEGLPQAVILDKWLPAVRDQGSIGSCVGFAMAANLASRGIASSILLTGEMFSPTWIYNGARFIEGTLEFDDGCWPKSALDWLLKKGALLEAQWRYNPNKLDKTPPPSILDAHASNWPLLKYTRCVDGYIGICSAINLGYYVSIGTPWFGKWLSTKTGVLASVKATDHLVGGHATCLYGYDIAKQVFYGINSWGTSWGASGLFTMPFSAFGVFKLLGGYDAHYIDVRWGQLFPKPEVYPKVRLLASLDDGKSWWLQYEGQVK